MIDRFLPGRIYKHEEFIDVVMRVDRIIEETDESIQVGCTWVLYRDQKHKLDEDEIEIERGELARWFQLM